MTTVTAGKSVPVDKQGDLSGEERVHRAMAQFAKDFGCTAAIYMESCVHCGECAEACHFYVATKDPKYTPIWKLEPFKRAYKRESSPFSLFYRLFNLEKAVTVDQLEQWQEYIYGSCTQCGRCTMVCPMGIDIAALVGQARHAMFHAGLAPQGLLQKAEKEAREGGLMGTVEEVRKKLESIAAKHGIKLPIDRDQADVMLTVSSIEIPSYPDALAYAAKVFEHMGISWTIRMDGYECTNLPMVSGNLGWQKDMTLKVINAAVACKAKTVIIPECGHAYTALRWSGANMFGKALPFEVKHMSEFLADAVASGGLRVKQVGRSVTFHDPCQVSRRGGATRAPRTVLNALGVELVEMESTGDLNWCCGGGGGVLAIPSASALRHAAFKIKMQQVDATGADQLVTTYANCRKMFDEGRAHFNWNRTADSLLQLVAENLAA